MINLSIEFSPGTTSGQIPDVVSAITYAHNHGVVVVGAAGNDEDNSLDFPAALPDVISVGATTRDRCLAVYSDVGKGLDLVAPGGGDDVDAVTGSQLLPARNLPDIYQMTFGNAAHPSQFGLPGGWFGTSMAAPDVSAAAAMVIASGVLGTHPTPDADPRPARGDRAAARVTVSPTTPTGTACVEHRRRDQEGRPADRRPSPTALAGASSASVVR